MKNNFIIINSDGSLSLVDKEFITCISGLDTPKKIGAYMLENFVKISYGKEGGSKANNLRKFWKTKKGNCVNFSEFGAFVADYHGYTAYRMGMSYEGLSEKHVIAIYEEDGRMSFTDNQDYFDNNGNWFNSFEEIRDFLCASHPGYQIKECILREYGNRIKNK